MALIDVTFYETRYGATSSDTQVAAFIDDISAEVVDYVTVLGYDASDWGVDSGDTEPPAAVQGVVARVVNRALSNPLGVSSEGLGDHNITFTLGQSGGTLGPKDRRIIRRAIRKLGVVALDMDGYLPLEDDLVIELVEESS